MSPTNHGAAAQLRNLIYYSLDNSLLRNAVFFAGRLQGLEPRSSEAAYLVALCHLRIGELKAAYDHSKVPGSRGTHLGCSYVFAQACLALERFAEGVTALEKSRGLWFEKNSWNKHTETRRQHMPDASAVFCLLGKLCQAHKDNARAVDNYAAALKLNPFMWDAFLGLCDLGVNVRIPNVFKMTTEMMNAGTLDEQSLKSSDDPPPLNISMNPPTNLTISHDPFNSVPIPPNGETRRPLKVPLYEKFNGSSVSITPIPSSYDSHPIDTFETPTNPGGPQNGKSKDAHAHVLDESAHMDPPLAPARKARPASTISAELGADIPPRLKASTVRTRLQSGTDSEDTEGNQIPTWNPSGMADRKRTASGQVGKTSVASTRSHGTSIEPTATQRRSTRILNSIRPGNKSSTLGPTNAANKDLLKDARKVKAAGTRTTASRTTAGRALSGNRRNGDIMEVDPKEARAIVPSGAPAPVNKVAASEKAKELEALRWLLDLFAKIGSGYYCLSTFRSEEALQIFKSLPEAQRETPWVLGQMGRAYYEQAKYVDAEKAFSRMRALCPSRLDDLEIHSTVLWHLKAEVDLAHLAHEIIEVDRLSPQAWCAVGNSLSLERNHEASLTAFKRATQIDPTFAYAWTLQGHEHVANEEFDKAMEAYRNGIEADNRHYNAWYGMGRVFEKQGKYDMAEAHYRFAATINPTNAVLICCIGGVLEKMKRPQLALDQYSRSCELAPKGVLSRFKKARVLMMLNMWDRALAELLVLKDLAPDEANVHFLLGRAYKTLRMKGEAIKHFTTALNLDPKASHHIKEAMEQMEDGYDDDGDEME